MFHHIIDFSLDWFSPASAETKKKKKNAEKCLYYPSFYKKNNEYIFKHILLYRDHMNIGENMNEYKVVKIGYKDKSRL